MISRLVVIPCLFFASSAQILHLTGKISGFDYKTKKGFYAEVFLNIPYASAPLGELRFEAPSPGFPIMFWVHGGGYESGSAVAYGYKALADIYIPRDIIVVTIQYRLGVYGFFSTGDSRMPGNLGLFDMAEALKFIHANAEKFGGDPSRITVCGNSAGSAAAGQLILSPVTRDYIPRSIEMSGSAWASFAQGVAVANHSLGLAKVLGCHANIKECMKQKSVEEIYEGIRKVVSISNELRDPVSCLIINLYDSTMDGIWGLKWTPVIDGEFLQHPEVMTAAAPPKISLVGVTNKEAALIS
ncbi:Carboxylesterase [Ancylostoma caninum]|uniref:Carboxylic ester hydrolase n=1 Tax=Ancylostoma caninum TaxID=29170 RepID=A0A368FWJ9_ANCCA|nr:Carboxylesterase [Ancylostoma caninum]